jgi:hypothetical protein
MNIFKNATSSVSSSSSRLKKPTPTIHFNQADFPELRDNSTTMYEKQEKTKSLDYKGASLMNDDDETKEEKKIPGWTYITMDKNTRKIQIENYNIPNTNPNRKLNLDTHEEASMSTLDTVVGYNRDIFSAFEARKGIAQLATSWEIYKQKYIQLYGEDCYRNMYEMSRDDYKFTDDDNHIEESSVDEYDSYDECYDEYDKYL